MFGLLKVAVYKEDKESVEYWKHTLTTTNDDELKEEIYQLFKNDAQKKGNLQKAYFYSKKLDSLNYKLTSTITTYQVDNVQRSYQRSVSNEYMLNQAHNKFYTSLIGCTVLLVLTSFMIIMIKRGKTHINSLEINVSQLDDKNKIMKNSIKEYNGILIKLQKK